LVVKFGAHPRCDTVVRPARKAPNIVNLVRPVAGSRGEMAENRGAKVGLVFAQEAMGFYSYQIRGY
jgi:hypothetical protein